MFSVPRSFPTSLARTGAILLEDDGEGLRRSYPEVVDRRRVGLVALVGAAALAGAVALLGGGLAEWVFATGCVVALAAVVGLGVRDWRRARRQRERAAALVAANPTAVARAAVRDERSRLSADIVDRLRVVLDDVAELADSDTARRDPGAAAGQIRAAALDASTELRRQLGLLREPPADDPRPADSPSSASRHGRWNLAITGAVTALAVVEAAAYPQVEGEPSSWLAVVLTGMAALTFLGRGTSAGHACLALAAIVVLAAAVDAPVVGGLWCLPVVGGLTWSAFAGSSGGRLALPGGIVLAASLGSVTWTTDRENAAAMLVLLAVSAAGGLGVRLARRRRSRADAVVRQRESAIAAATDVAVAAERRAFAREIHDIVSHSVGVIAVQAAAVQVSWPDDPAAARAALDVISRAARTAVDELDRLQPGTAPASRTGDDLERLAARVRAAGTPVLLTGVDAVPADRAALVYRLVQETLTNVMSHTEGAAARVTITDADGEVRVVVADDGPGASDDGDLRGYGLIGLAERVAQAGGTLTVENRPAGTGFQVRATLPATPVPVS